MKIQFTLSMPNVGSWNGRWSGEGTLYAIVREVSPKKRATLKPSYYYRWDDGWGASVAVKEIDGKESRRIKRLSKGFCGYDWMVDSILTHGAIYADHQIPKEAVI